MLNFANILTFIRLVLSVPLALTIVNGYYTFALGIAVIGSLTDFIDGKLARKNGNGNGIGKVLDPLADKVFVISGLIALVDVERISSIPVILIVFREFLISFLRSILMSAGTLMGASFMSKLKTSLEFASIILILYNVNYGIYVLWSSVILAYISAFDYLRLYWRSISELNYR